MTTPSFTHPAGTFDATPALSHLTNTEAAFTALGYAIQRGDLPTIHAMLDGDKFTATAVHHPNQPQSLLSKADYAGNTAMHLAAMSANPGVIRELLTRGASVHARNAANNTPLFLARRTANRECVEILEGAGGHLWVDERRMSGASTPKEGSFPLSRPMSPGM